MGFITIVNNIDECIKARLYIITNYLINVVD